MDLTDLSAVAAAVRPQLDGRFTARERGLANSRRVIRASANAIRNLHRGQVEEAEALMAEAETLLADTVSAMADHPSVFHAGFVWDAAKEYAEARITAAIFTGAALPLPADLGLDPVPYLHGLGEAVGECRRRLLDTLRAGDLDQAEHLLTVMDAIVDMLADLDYPDGMTSSLRRTTDVSRSLVERSRSDLTATAVQERLRRDLERRPL
ncbi:MAG: haloacid dehalogenase [Acidimicrobiia bacterium]